MTRQHDVIVVGAGPAGSATAYFLARRGADVLLLDKSDFPRDKTCGDALSPRALRVLDEMGLLAELAKTSYCVNTLRLYAPNGVRAQAPVPSADGLPRYALVVPRLRLDACIQARAVGAGARFVGKCAASDVVRDDGGAVVGVRGKTPAGEREFRARGIVIATGAATRLLQRAALLPGKPALMLAARAYFENVAGIEGQIEFYFNHVSLPGYGWAFPTSSSAANVGVGYVGGLHRSPRVDFDRFVAGHPRLREILAAAEQVGPVRGFPLRVDFHRSRKVGHGVVAVGESIGLVNPFTGEGIDYALESGQMAAQVLGDLLERGAPWTPANLRGYVRSVDRRFHKLFVLMTLARRVYYNRLMLNRIFGSGRQPLLNTLVDVCFSNADPALAFAPRTLWEIARP